MIANFVVFLVWHLPRLLLLMSVGLLITRHYGYSDVAWGVVLLPAGVALLLFAAGYGLAIWLARPAKL